MEKEIRCKECGALCEADDTYCPKCHASISVQEIKNENMLEGIEIETWKQYIGDRAVKYIEIFKRHENKKVFLSFNPYAFFMGTRWMHYRGMYLYAIVLDAAALLLMILWAYITSISSPLMLIIFPMCFLYELALGLFSNCAYKNITKKRILENKTPKKRATSRVAAFIATLIFLLVLIFVVVPIVMDLILKIQPKPSL